MMASFRDIIIASITYNMFVSTVAVLGLEQTVYNVAEPEGSVEVCVILQNQHPDYDVNDEDTCYIGFSLYLQFITSPDTACK